MLKVWMTTSVLATSSLLLAGSSLPPEQEVTRHVTQEIDQRPPQVIDSPNCNVVLPLMDQVDYPMRAKTLALITGKYRDYLSISQYYVGLFSLMGRTAKLLTRALQKKGYVVFPYSSGKLFLNHKLQLKYPMGSKAQRLRRAKDYILEHDIYLGAEYEFKKHMSNPVRRPHDKSFSISGHMDLKQAMSPEHLVAEAGAGYPAPLHVAHIDVGQRRLVGNIRETAIEANVLEELEGKLEQAIPFCVQRRR